MKPTENSTAAPTSSNELCCDVLAYGSTRLTLDQFPTLRQRPGPGIGQSLPNNFLKHADEQTVAALVAVLQAIDQFGMTEVPFRDWGVVAAPMFLGRATLVIALQRYAAEGAWGLSPHFIPHRSQHAVAGTISQALKIHGPNFGSGGGPGGIVEALLAGAVLQEGSQLPGVWVVFTGWEPEFIPDENAKPKTDAVCLAGALALVDAGASPQGMRLRVLPARRDERNGCRNGVCHAPAPTLPSVQSALAGGCELPAKLTWQLPAGGVIELELGVAGTNNCGRTIGQRPVGRAWNFQQAGAGTENKR